MNGSREPCGAKVTCRVGSSELWGAFGGGGGAVTCRVGSSEIIMA